MVTMAKLSVHDVARECLNAARNDRAKATALFLRKLEREPDVAALLKERLIEIAVETVIRNASPTTSGMMARVRWERVVTASTPRLTADQERAAMAACYSWMLTPIYGGATLLKDATRPQLIESATHHRRQEAGHGRSAMFHEALAKRLNNDNDRLGEVLTEAQVNEIARTL